MKTIHAILTAVILPILAARADVWASFAGRLLLDKPVPLALEAKGALAPWRMMHAAGMTERPDGTRDIAFSAPDAPGITGTFRVTDGKDPDAIEAEWTFTPSADVRMEMFGLMGDLRMADYGGGTLIADGESIRLPELGAPQDIRRAEIARLEISDKAGGRRLAFAFQEPTDLFVQYWGNRSMSLRFILPPDVRPAGIYRGGVTRRLAFALQGAGQCMKSALSPVTIEEGPDWIPLTQSDEIAEGSALDFSALRPQGKPAGKFGRVVARGGHFEFEGMPGVPQRFYGVNLCNLANYPKTQEDARKIARTLARVGYNSIRIHHHDAWCVDKADPARVRLDEAMMRRMDWLVAACIEEGIYISTDLFVSRTGAGIPWRAVGVDRDGDMTMADFKRTVYVHEGVYSNFLAFAGNWLSHTNAVTGRRYADEPALAWISLVNEANVDDVSGNDCLSRPGWREAWDKWLAQRKAERPERFADITAEIPNGLGKNRQGRAYLLFLRDVETQFAKRTRAFLNSLGCHALLTDMNNNGLCSAAMQFPRQEAFDFVDTHFYVDHPAFLETAWRLPSWCPNTNPFKGETMGAANVSAVRVFGRPFTVSEYNFSGPGRFRGVGGIATGAEAALQDWAGLWRFAWSHNEETALHPGMRPSGFFDIAADPMQMASERASVCLFLRGDAAPLSCTYAVTLPRTRLDSPDEPIATSAKPDWVWAAWCAQIGAVVDGGDAVSSPRNDGQTGAPLDSISAGPFDTAFMKSADEAYRDLGLAKGGEVGAGAVRVDPARGTFLIETPRTCGLFAESGAHRAGPLSVTICDAQRPGANDGALRANDDGALRQMTNDGHSAIAAEGRTSLPPSAACHSRAEGAPVIDRGGASAATVWASSLDGAPLPNARRILLTHLTDVQNTGVRYADEAMTVLTDFGRLPCLLRAGTAKIELCVESPASCHVYALDTAGRRRAEVPCRVEDGRLSFTASSRQPFGGCLHYEIVR